MHVHDAFNKSKNLAFHVRFVLLAYIASYFALLSSHE